MEIPKSWKWRDEKRHLVAEINDGDTPLVVYKYWLSHKQRWSYKTEPKSIIEYELSLLERDKD
ncbi:hypothetical protein C2E16_11650 [Mixta calida]|uniref:Uncharacterized protein n=1 Tax=Mixta calida TaxID=665913 RepID=A0ABM6S227_9GAMM|nr:hypothetical protein C2E16_11650 [Mixta calida]ORM62025.1 hypothetical protein HA40_04170 [Mixta calida]DAV47352.1 MAG TPA: hypothetical protein [Caudoviricetes sp.]